MVLRVLAAYIEGLTLTDLGLSQRHQTMLEEAAAGGAQQRAAAEPQHGNADDGGGSVPRQAH